MAKNDKLAVRSAKGTFYFIEEADGLKQGYDLRVSNPGSSFQARVGVCWDGGEYWCDGVAVGPGDSKIRAYIPDIRKQQRITFKLEYPNGAAELNVNHKPQRHWTVHITQFAHHDPGYTDLPSAVFREYSQFYDDVLRFCAETDHFAEDDKFRYTIEQGWSLLYFLDHRPPEVREEMMRRIKEGRIEVNAMLGNAVTELFGPEEMARSLYPVFALKREYGIPVVTAEHNDIPGISWGVSAALADSGIKYFAPALPDYFRWGPQYHTFWDEDIVCPRGIPHAFWWEAPDGQKILFWYHRQGAGGHLDPNFSGIPDYLEELEKKDYPYDVLRYIVNGGARDNAPPRVDFAYSVREWNSKWAYPKFISSLNSRFFPELEQQLADDTPVWKGELPGTDYSAAASCTAYPSSLNRVTHDQLLAAERFAAVASELTDYGYPAQILDEAYYCTLMNDEHAWGLAHPTGPGQEACIAQHCEYGYRAAALAHDVLAKSVNRIADNVKLSKKGYHVVVFNPMSTPRTDVVTVPARPTEPCARPMGYYKKEMNGPSGPPAWKAGFTLLDREMVTIPDDLMDGGFEVVDAVTGESVQHEFYKVTTPQDPIPYASYRFAMSHYHPKEAYEARFVAQDVPPMGYKVYRLVPSEKNRSRAGVKVGERTLENKFYKVELDRTTGGIKSIYDKQLQRELIDKDADWAANQMVLRSSVTAEVSTSGKAVIEKGRSNPVCGSLIVKTTAPGYPQITQEIILYSQIKRIDIANRVLKDSTPMLETFFAFPFAFDKPKFRYEGSMSVIEPLVDQFPGSNSEYYAIQHWADVHDDGCGVAWCSVDAPMAQFGGMYPLYISQAHHGVTPPDFDHPFHTAEDVDKGHIYSFALLNNYRTNFNPTQCADLLFRYSITSHDGDWQQGKARDFGYGVGMPLIPAPVEGKQDGSLPTSSCFCEVDNDNVLLVTVKRAEDGNGFIVRLLETEGRDTDVSVSLPFVQVTAAYETNLVEENERIIPVKGKSVGVKINAWGNATLRLIT